VSRLAGRLVVLYPRAWRERYEEEFVAMLEQGSVSIRGLFDIVLGAADAWLRPQVAYDGRLVMVARMRGSVLAVLWAWVGLVIAGVGFRKMTEYEDFVRAARDSTLVGVAFDAVVVGAFVALVAVMVGCAPVAYVALRKALAEGRKDVPLLLCMPLLCGAGFIAYTLLLVKVIYPALGHIAIHGAVNVALFLSLVGAFSLAALAGAWMVTLAVRRAEVGGQVLRFAVYLAAVAGVAMAVVLAGTTAWGVGLLAQAPALFSGDEGILETPTYADWLAIVAVMTASTAIAVIASIRGLRALSIGHASSSRL
jgi:hypothetical protein